MLKRVDSRNKPAEGSAGFLAVFGGIGSHCLALDPALALAQGAMGHSKFHFDPEKLIACQRSIEFVTWASRWLEAIPARMAVLDQLDRASTSVPLNIAEGNAQLAWMGSWQREKSPRNRQPGENGFYPRPSPC